MVSPIQTNSSQNSENNSELSTSPAPEPSKTNSKKYDFSRQQVDCICNVLIKSSEIPKLSKFLKTLPDSYLTIDGTSQVILRAKVEVAYSESKFKEVYNLLETGNFDEKYHPHLQNIWYSSHYKEAEGMRQRALGGLSTLKLLGYDVIHIY